MFDYKRLRQRRLDMGLTLEEVGDSAGMSRSAVHKYEKGVIKNVYTSTVELFAKALRCSPAYLMGWAADPAVTVTPADFTPREIEIVEAYRKQPHLQEAVEKVLGVHRNDHALKLEELKKRNLSQNDMEAANEIISLAEEDAKKLGKNNRKIKGVD